MNLQIRFTLVISGMVALLSCGFLGFLYLAERNHLLNESEGTREDVVKKLSRVCEESVLSKDEIMLFNYLKDLARSPDILWAMFLDPSGKVLNHSTLSLKNKILEDDASRKSLAARSTYRQSYPSPEGLTVLEYAIPVRIGDKKIGTARLGYDVQRLQDRVEGALQAALRRFLGVTLLSFLIGILLAFYVAKTLTRPIQILSSGVRQVGRGDLNTRIPVVRKDEIGQLSNEFNLMAEKLGELDKLKDRFITSVSHDLRNPLSAIRMSTNYLLSSEFPREEQRKILDIILESTERLNTMVLNILDVAKMKAGRMKYNKKPVLPGKMIQEIFSLYEVPAREKGVALRTSLPKRLPPIEVDEGMIHRVFTNIVSNALKFTREGDQITIGAASHRQSRHLQFFVADTGYGIPDKEMPLIFQRFSSVSDVHPSVKKQKGAGLGLAIAKGIVEDHGGRIWIESKLGKGTTFYWTLPVSGKRPTDEGVNH